MTLALATTQPKIGKEVYFGMERNGLISALEVEAGLEYYRRETRPATEAEEHAITHTLNYRNDAH